MPSDVGGEEKVALIEKAGKHWGSAATVVAA